MPDFVSWMSGENFIDAPSRAVEIWNEIQDRPTSVVLIRAGVNQPAQTMRVEAGPSPAQRPAGGNPQLSTQGVLTMTVFGVRNHPTIPDTDIRRNDRFVVGGTEYRVMNVVLYTGGVQAAGEAAS